MTFFKTLFFLCFSINCFSSDIKNSNLDGAPGSSHLALFLIGMVCAGEWRIQQAIRTKVSHNIVTDSEGKEGALLVYSPQQRTVAADRQIALTLGLSNLIKFVIRPTLPLAFRSSVTPFFLAESALLPAVVYNSTKDLLNTVLPSHVSHATRATLAGISAITLPQLVIASGASPERIIINACMCHFLAHQHNKYVDVAYLRSITGSLAYASKVMPLTQMAISMYNRKPGMLTVYPVMVNGINNRTEFMHGVIPALVLTGVDLTFNAVARTPVGVAIESGVDSLLEIAVKPLPEQVRQPVKKVTKKAMTETVKIGTAVGVTSAIEASGCTMQ